MSDHIRIVGARQNNLKNLSLDIALNEITVVTGVSGSGKSSLVFDTLYAEGQRRYVETFSPYARQFLDRMDKPQVDRIEGVPPAIAIDQTNPVKSSRSTVGTMTELADHFKLLYARAARLYCRGCGAPVRRDDPDSIFAALVERCAADDPRLVLTFAVPVPANFSEDEITALLNRQGYTRIHLRESAPAGDLLHVVQDRLRLSNAGRSRVIEAIETALQHGHGHLAVCAQHDGGETVWRFSRDLHCADCDIHYAEPTPGLFSFNSPLGACETCRGFGRVIGVDFALVIPDESKTLAEGAVKPWQTASYRECQEDMAKMAKKYGVAMDIPFRDLPPEHRRWVLEGDPEWKSWDASWPRKWYGVRHFFDWLESKAYKMHIRVLLSRYRSYTECPACHGARLKPEALLWRLGDGNPADSRRPGLAIHELMALPVSRVRDFIARIELPAGLDEATGLLLGEIRSRLDYLANVGLAYLTLDRQSRTLSGGEVQRINLTTALGTSLVNTLFVLDEPSIGLHPRDIDRILAVMTRLRDAGNTLVVVEHDPQLMRAADRLLDIGPGPGERGGEIVGYAPPATITADPASLTGAYLAGRKRVDAGRRLRPVLPGDPLLRLVGAREHNLRGIDVDFPLGRLVCVSGVSGSGKSSLIQDVLYPALAKRFGQGSDATGAFARLEGAETLAGVVMVDQSAIGKSARSNPVSYVGAWDAIRALFAALPEATSRGYTPGTFSFNAGTGRCPTCNGSGFEHVEMQFLSDVYLRCPDCDGKRYRPEVLELAWRGRSVADVLALTVSEALAFFADQPAVQAALAPLADVGLDYLRLGQPVPTLSGGEAQRLKLAGHLADSAKLAGRRPAGKAARSNAQAPGRLLFLFDEPTTGLHFDDVATLLRAFEKLLDAGHALVVIEHNLDVLRAADWIIDLGPEGGEDGGTLVVAGPPDAVIACAASHTGRALRAYDAEFAAEAPGAPPANGLVAAEPAARYRPAAPAIEIRHAREHNLKNVSLSIPRDRFTVITGLSGSGKSTLAFDIVFGEGQRRYLESLNAYARQFVQPAARPDVDALFGIPPTVAIEQRVSRGGRKSTVGTLTEIQPFLRLLYVKLGTQYCPQCDVPVSPQSFDAIAAQVQRDYRGTSIELLAPLVTNRKGLYTAIAKWAKGKGYTQLRVDGEYVPTAKWPRLDRYVEHTIELPVGMVVVAPEHEAALRMQLAEALEHGKGVVKVLELGKLGASPATFSTLRACPCCGDSFPEPDPRLFSYNAKHGWCPSCYGTGQHVVGRVEDANELDLADTEQVTDAVCAACEGTRLNPVARAVRFRERGIHELSAQPVAALAAFFDGLRLVGREIDIARDLVAEIRGRLDFLQQVGLAYLALDRGAPTLSGGEAQRIRLAAQLGSNLRGVCYILDEPTIGLHPRDNRLLLDTLERLRDRGNTLLVVEHDEETIRRADHVIDLGPGAGVRGGRVVAEGRLADLIAAPESATGAFLRAPLQHPLRPRRPLDDAHPAIRVVGANLHNLRDVSAAVPLARLTVVTGVSGSGKSTLARDVIHANLGKLLGDPDAARARRRGQAQPQRSDVELLGCRAIEGWQAIGRVLEVDQTPIGKTPRSCPATYVGFWDAVRKLFAETFEARTRGWSASRFSFNTGAGRCPVCEGQGQTTVEMSFLPDVKLPCDACGGARFNPETLAVRWRDKTVADVLAMPVDEAVGFFAAHPSIAHPLALLQDVGLGYLTLGQSSPTLSGGEAQRIKLVTELAKVRSRAGDSTPMRAATAGRPLPAEKHTLYVLDEPTVGLHMADVDKLIRVLQRLADAGHTVLAIEHDLDVMAEADWLIDLGPEGGDGGGEIVAQGPVEAVCECFASHTAVILKEFLAARSVVSVGTPAEPSPPARPERRPVPPS
ncbi:similar to excinuclease ABC subunit A (DNA repair ATP-binding) [Aromatoleum aromaticum EbN1]|uniref:UvrABC system protein A n=1 Tax=Aromatoleum aromaticum (strain DSM 19018 / LMG 30748 / EbN1) TaxID=76114 RepID=Q5P4G6_AROAE|nr:excinuclease ABC subunit UvrA [Aromatoleum aromaticum]CAI07797.1 similar to excinuclease ABC subunit A (DNA repair ATP-binding) [Aromatoleum aromaticum EbN1]